MLANGDANTQYDFHGDNSSRPINAARSPSAFLEEPMSEQRILDLFLIGDRADQGVTVADNGRFLKWTGDAHAW